jgi:hypothetical protein
MTLSEITYKIKHRIWSNLVRKTRAKSYYPKFYKAYWYACYHKPSLKGEANYFTAVPNRGAGIGHQMANWIAGFWFAKQFDLHFAHIPFSTQKWEGFLAFGVDEITVKDLINSRAYKKVRLPLFDEKNTDEVASIQKIIASYGDQKVVFVCEQDQFYRDQFGVMEEIKQKFHRANEHKKDKLIYSKENFNIAIHVRRGDIVIGQDNKNPNLLMRWQDNTYFEKVLSSVVENVKTDKPIAIYLVSQGVRSDFPEFEKFENIHFCLDMGAQDSFLHMATADLLITSKSSFSYKPALLSDGIKVCPENFWHGYPKTEDFVMVNDEGVFDRNTLR